LTLLDSAAVPGGLLAADAFANAIGPAVRATPEADRTAVAMSGGVDSAVALLRARRAGAAVGVTLRLWIDPAGPTADRACCSPEAVVAARRLCHGLGIPHVTLDLREQFRRGVVAPFVGAYERGETPNPCVRCNGSFRFGALLAFAKRVGASRLATGHYARTVERRGRLLLARGVDPAKDQSYMLGRLDPRCLPRLWFPLGEQGKDETRAEAQAAGLAAAGRRESQDACFLAGDDYRSFVERHGLVGRPGPVLDRQGAVVGSHDGYWRVTPGQRRGIGVTTGGGPFYALGSDPGRNAVVVGPRDALARDSVTVRPGRLHVPVADVEVKLRYRSPAISGRVTPNSRGFRIDLDEPFYGVAPGQAAVLYDDDAVVGAGVIAGAGSLTAPAS
jgi:tRNA-specific 2-thiouridylase